MIKLVSGDMFEVPAEIRINTVNCVGVMGAGVALAFKKRYPEMFKEYKSLCESETIKPGFLHTWNLPLENLTVVNFPTKRHWRAKSRYEDIEIGLKELRAFLENKEGSTVTLPALGCGHGGLEWDRVLPMIEESLADLKCDILVFQPADSRSYSKKKAQ